MKNKERILEINNRLSELEPEVEGATIERLAEINTEVNKLKEERTKLQTAAEEEVRRNFEAGEEVVIADEVKERLAKEKMEKRISDLKENRAISIDSVDILHIKLQGNKLNTTFNEVSGLVDKIGFKNKIGAESYEKGYIKGYGTGGYTAEGIAATVSEPTWGYATITKTKITAYTEVSEEMEKLGAKMYLDDILKNLSISLKKKLAIEVLLGDGAAGHMTGINSAAAILVATDLQSDAIDENTLDDIIFAYGGDEDLESGTLILSKSALRDFSKVRGTQDKKKVYTIDTAKKTIDGVSYVINSAYNAPSAAAAGEVYMAYGALSAYELDVFSQIQVSKSADFKFNVGQIAYKAVGFFGGNVAALNGFLRIKKVVV